MHCPYTVRHAERHRSHSHVARGASRAAPSPHCCHTRPRPDRYTQCYNVAHTRRHTATRSISGGGAELEVFDEDQGTPIDDGTSVVASAISLDGAGASSAVSLDAAGAASVAVSLDGFGGAGGAASAPTAVVPQLITTKPVGAVPPLSPTQLAQPSVPPVELVVDASAAPNVPPLAPPSKPPAVAPTPVVLVPPPEPPLPAQPVQPAAAGGAECAPVQPLPPPPETLQPPQTAEPTLPSAPLPSAPLPSALLPSAPGGSADQPAEASVKQEGEFEL